MKKPYFLLLSAVVLTTACEQAQQAKQGYENLSKLKEVSTKLESTIDEAKTQREEREKRGDTLSLPYKELQAYLPASVSGYTAENPEGQSTKMSGFAFSTATRKFSKQDASVKVELMDYNGAHELYQGAAAMFGMGLESENDEELVKSADMGVKNTSGMETFHKKDGRAEIMLAVGGRFLIKVEADKQPDLALVESVAKQLDLEKLAGM